MTCSDTVPIFAIIGHPNEGKSSVLSTLAEDDSVRISPIPGETTVCQEFPVIIDGKEVLRFVDTPGFQNPRKTLQWMREYQGAEDEMIAAFIKAHTDDPSFKDDCELLKPVGADAGVIFVVDGSRPVRNIDRAEMEILRLTGARRMAIINSKEEEGKYLQQWQHEFRKHFNAIRVFNSFRANYIQRIELLENLKGIDQQWQPVLKDVVEAFKADWQGRIDNSVEIMLSFLGEVLGYTQKVYCTKEKQDEVYQAAWGKYKKFLTKKEQRVQKQIRSLFKHNIFDITLPEHSLLKDDLFSRTTWEFLGLTDRQIIVAGAMSGAALGAGIDLAAAGITFGVFSAIGTMVGGLGTAIKGKQLLSKMNILGMRMGGEQLQIGPVDNPQLIYILIDRVLLFYAHVINWAHGRRDYAEGGYSLNSGEKGGFTSSWEKKDREICSRFLKAVTGESSWEGSSAANLMRNTLRGQLLQIAEDRSDVVLF